MSLLSVEDALARLDEATHPLPAVEVELADALGRVTCGALCSNTDLPPFDQSAMDGYAVRTADLRQVPTTLPLSGVVAAGPQEREPQLAPGTTCRIYTGGLIPRGADAVVRQEWTARNGDQVTFLRETPVGQDIRPQGEELAKGAPLIEAGVRLNAGHLAMLGMAGVARLKVSRAPRIRVLVSGDEIVPAGQVLRPGEVYDANGPLTRAWLSRAGYSEITIERLIDDEAAVADSLRRAFSDADLVLSSGGVSVGDRDLIAPQAEALGASRVLWKVAQKPGKPLYVARMGSALLLGLPGNPGSVLVNLAVFVRHALDRLEGLAVAGPRLRHGVLTAPVQCDGARDRWLRVRVDTNAQGQVLLHPQGGQASHMLSNLAAADSLAWIRRADGELATGSVVEWLSLGV